MEEETKNKQHVQVPNSMASENLTPRDVYIYSVIKSHDGPAGCFPSLETISKESEISVPTVRKSIQKLIDSSYLTTEKRGRKKYYKFSKYRQFEPVSKQFLDNKEISPKTKGYLIASQQFMFKNIEGLGKMAFSTRELSSLINMPQATIVSCNTELTMKGYMTKYQNDKLDEAKGHTYTNIYLLNKLGQAVIWKLKDHEDRITQNAAELADIKQELASLKEDNKNLKELLARVLKSQTKEPLVI